MCVSVAEALTSAWLTAQYIDPKTNQQTISKFADAQLKTQKIEHICLDNCLAGQPNVHSLV